jgi:hypothetical protein
MEMDDFLKSISPSLRLLASTHIFKYVLKMNPVIILMNKQNASLKDQQDYFMKKIYFIVTRLDIELSSPENVVV